MANKHDRLRLVALALLNLTISHAGTGPENVAGKLVVPCQTQVTILTNHTLTFPALNGWQHQLESRDSQTGDWGILSSLPLTNSASRTLELPGGLSPDNARITAIPPVDRESYETIMIAGQSNAGLSDYPSFPQREERVIYLGKDFAFKHPSRYYPEFDTRAFAYSFSTAAAAELAEARNLPYLLIPTAVGGTSMSQWQPSADRFDRATLYGDANFRRVAGSPKPIRALWYYGHESNTAEPVIRTYAADWMKLMAEFRTDAGNIPVIFAQLARSTDEQMNRNTFAGAELQRQSEAGQLEGIPDTHMVVTFDLPLGDPIHLSGAAQRELGHRFALATRQHVYRESVNGTGPRLKSVKYLPESREVVEIEFDCPINEAVKGYDGQFSLSSQGEAVEVSSIGRGPGGTSVLIHLKKPQFKPVAISYGDIPAPDPGERLAYVIRDLSGLPAPRFGPVTIP